MISTEPLWSRSDTGAIRGLLGEWSGRELIAHLGYWTGHATEVIHLLEVGRITDDDLGGQTVDEWCEWHWYGHAHAQGVPGSVLSGHGSPHRTLNWPSS